MTAKEKAQLRGFWTHKKTGEHIAVTRVTSFSEVHTKKANCLGHEFGPKEIMLIRDLKSNYLKGLH